jgi:hypothetical protein
MNTLSEEHPEAKGDYLACSIFSPFDTDAVPAGEIVDGSVSGIDYNSKRHTKYYLGEGYNDESASKYETFISRIYKLLSSDVPSGLMFPAVRYSVPGFLVFERPPVNKFVEYVDVPIDYMDKGLIERSYKYDLSLPWQLYVAEYDPKSMLLTQVHMYFMKESLRGLDQKLYAPPLPNFFANGALCRPFLPDMEDIERYEKNLAGIMASAYDWVWNSGFNHDLVEGLMTVNYHKDNFLYDVDHQRTSPTANWHRFMHPKDVNHILSIWEKCGLDNILSVEWPNLSVTRHWDHEVEWFYNHAPEYPYQDDECFSDNLEQYSEDYPIRVYNLCKNFEIMMRSVITSSSNFIQSHHSSVLRSNFLNRFSIYNRAFSQNTSDK